MRSSRFGENGKKAEFSVRVKSAVACQGGRAVGMDLARDHAPPCPSDRKIDLAARRRFSLHECQIDLGELPPLHGKRELMCRKDVVCGEHDTARFPVKTRDSTENVGSVGVSVGKRVCQRVIVVPVGGMRGHIPALVAQGDVPILVQDGNGKVAGEEIFVCLGIRDGERKRVARMQDGTDGDVLPVEKNTVLPRL